MQHAPCSRKRWWTTFETCEQCMIYDFRNNWNNWKRGKTSQRLESQKVGAVASFFSKKLDAQDCLTFLNLKKEPLASWLVLVDSYRSRPSRSPGRRPTLAFKVSSEMTVKSSITSSGSNRSLSGVCSRVPSGLKTKPVPGWWTRSQSAGTHWPNHVVPSLNQSFLSRFEAVVSYVTPRKRRMM